MKTKSAKQPKQARLPKKLKDMKPKKDTRGGAGARISKMVIDGDLSYASALVVDPSNPN